MRKALVGTGLATVATAVAGSVASREGVQGWYTKIRKPGYVPPNAVFPIAWTTLYVDIAATPRRLSTGTAPTARTAKPAPTPPRWASISR